MFAHNGTVDRKALLGHLSGTYRKNIKSETDSEVYFRLILQKMEEEEDKIQGIRGAVSTAKSSKGMNFIMSDGGKLFAFRFGRELYYLERDPSSPFSATSEETQMLMDSKGFANERAILVCSQRLTDEHWREVQDGELVVFDARPRIQHQEIIM